MTPLPLNTTCFHKKSTRKLLPGEIARVRNEEPSSCYVFSIDKIFQDETGLDVNLPYYRHLFEANDVTRGLVVKRKSKYLSPNVAYVAVHIRRGDLRGHITKNGRSYESKVKEAEKRLVEVSAYTSVLNQLLRRLAEMGKDEVHVRLFCEGMQPPARVPNTKNWNPVDIREDIIFNSSIQNVTFHVGSNDALQAFEEMCFSDIFITGTSGFGHFASILCKTPVILAIPFWRSYDYIPNAMTLDVVRGAKSLPVFGIKSAMLIESTSFNETTFGVLWQDRS